jgi:hypothetical protein
LTGFLKREFRQEKGHQQQLWRVCVDGQERSFTGQKPFETAFYFLSRPGGFVNVSSRKNQPRILRGRAKKKEVIHLNLSCLETTDIFRGAFFMCNGGKLCEVRIREDSRQIVSFLIEGEGIDQLDLDYRNGDALVNPLHFRETLNLLRDILFSKLRTGKDKGRTRHDDRKRNDRAYKEKR